MSTKYRTTTPLLISVSGLDIELDLMIEYSISKYRSATLTQPEEPSTLEIENVFAKLNGNPVDIPHWLGVAIESSAAFMATLLEDAADKDAAAADDAAEARRERQWEDAR